MPFDAATRTTLCIDRAEARKYFYSALISGGARGRRVSATDAQTCEAPFRSRGWISAAVARLCRHAHSPMRRNAQYRYGSGGRIRTYDQSVNSRLLYR
jgi:hypothetical protein